MNAWFPRITVHSLAIVLSVLTYVLTTRVEHERRPPSIAIAWVLGMIAVPYVVLPMYLMFGRRKLPRRVLRWSGIGSHCAHWAEDLIESFGLRPCAPAVVRLHHDGNESAAALFATMSDATRRLDLCTYILGNDAFGRRAMQCMAECAQRGVQVRVLIDGVGAMQLPRSCFDELHRAGIETAIFSPLFARKTQGPRNLRNHRKMVIADGMHLWAGGRNIAAEYFVGVKGAPAVARSVLRSTGCGRRCRRRTIRGRLGRRRRQTGRDGRGAIPRDGPAGGRRLPRPVSTLRSGPGGGYGARLADRRMLSCPRSYPCRDALLRSGRRSGNGNAPRRTPRGQDRFVHSLGLESPSGGFRRATGRCAPSAMPGSTSICCPT